MALNVIWSTASNKEYVKVLKYVYAEFGLRAAETLKREVDTCLGRIAKNPEIAAQEELLKGETCLYRSKIVGKHNKIVYKCDSENIYISDFWDMRREPSALSRRIKRK